MTPPALPKLLETRLGTDDRGDRCIEIIERQGGATIDAETVVLCAEAWDDALAAEIVRRWNAHDDLVAARDALAALIAHLEANELVHGPQRLPVHDCVVCKARGALAKARAAR